MKRQQQRDKRDLSTIGIKTELIHLDLYIEILQRLPVKSLLKFKCVSKQWCSIVRSRSFTDYIMSLSPPRLLLGYDVHNGNENRLLFLSWPLLPQESNDSSSIVSIGSRISPRTYIALCNSVNGISLLYFSDYRFLICNPTTRQVLEIPNDLSGFDPKYKKHCYMCLGYATKKDQYKILRRMVSKDGSVKHSVCTLERGQKSSFSSWRHVECNFSYYEINHIGLCINGVVYHEAEIKQSKKKSSMIESFDVGSERLLLIEAPKEFELKSTNDLINYQGKLACFIIKNDKSYTLWVLEDVQKQIWSNKTDDFPPSSCDFRLTPTFLGTTDAGEIVLKQRRIRRCCRPAPDSIELLIYDLQRKNVREGVKVGGSRDRDELRSSQSNSVRRIATLCDHVDNIITF